MSQDHPEHNPNKPQSADFAETPLSGSTTHDLRHQALEAIRMLRESSATQTLPIDARLQAPPPAEDQVLSSFSETPAPIDEPAALLELHDLLCLTLIEDGKQFTLTLSAEPLIIGRSDTVSQYEPNIDLSDYGAYRLGLSRKHAQIARQGHNVWLIDLGGRNGTQLNGQRIQAHRPYVLRDGDEILFGNLATRVSFQRQG